MALQTLTRGIYKNVATLTFDAQRAYFADQGDTITISGVKNPLYNVTAVVLASGLDYVQYVVNGRDELEVMDAGGSIAFISAADVNPGRYVQIAADGRLPALDGSQLQYIEYGAFSADDESKWLGNTPTTLRTAINRIAAVVGAAVPIP